MPFRRALVALGLAVAVAAGAPAGASTARAAEAARFDITISGIRAGELTLSGARNGASYEAGTRVRATGLLGAVSRIRYDGTTNGRVARDGRLVPDVYNARSRSMRSERDTEIVFQNGDPVRVSVVPPRATQVDPATQAGAIDPVSAAYTLLLDTRADSICNMRVDLFDGLRRSRILVGRAENRGGTYVCNGRYQQLEGLQHDLARDGEWGFQLFYRPNGDGTVTLERIETPTRFGMAIITRRS